jgi:hypothetical protein
VVVIRIPLNGLGNEKDCPSSLESTVRTVWPEGMASSGGRMVSLRPRGRYMELEGRYVVVEGVNDEARVSVVGPGPAQTKDTEDPRRGKETMS